MNIYHNGVATKQAVYSIHHTSGLLV